MYASISRNLAGACGTFTLCHFSETEGNPNYHPGWREVTKESLEKYSSIGVFYAGFLPEDPLSEKMFAHLSSIAAPVYVSPVRRNPNSGNMFYFAVFELSDKLNKEEI